MLLVFAALVFYWVFGLWLTIAALAGFWLLFDADIATTICSKLTKRSFAGKVVWVTGASSGIGEHLAYELDRRGAKLILSARRESELSRVLSNCTTTKGHIIVPLDLSNHDSHQDVVKQVLSKVPHVDIVIHNAGRSQRSLFEDTQLSVDKMLLDLNTLGTVSLTKAVLPHIIDRSKKTQDGPMFVVISSLAGKLGSPAAASYSASKHALHGFFDTLRMEMRPYNIDVTLVCPGPVKSEGAETAVTATGGVAKSEGTPVSAYNHRRMDTDRAVSLIVAGIDYRLKEIWVSPHPELAYTYLRQYAPTLFNFLSVVMGTKRVLAFKSQLKKE